MTDEAGEDERERGGGRQRQRALAQAEWPPERWARHRWREGHAIYVPEVDPC